MAHTEVVYLFKGVTSRHAGLLNKFNSQKLREPEVLHRVSASSQSALPPSAEMDMISRQCPNIHFSPSIYNGLVGSRKTIPLDLIMDNAGMASIFYVDKRSRIFYNGAEIKMNNIRAVRVVIHNKSLVRYEPLSPVRLTKKRSKVLA